MVTSYFNNPPFSQKNGGIHPPNPPLLPKSMGRSHPLRPYHYMRAHAYDASCGGVLLREDERVFAPMLREHVFACYRYHRACRG